MFDFLAHHPTLMAVLVPLGVVVFTLVGMTVVAPLSRRTGREGAGFVGGFTVILAGVAASLGVAWQTVDHREALVTDAVLAKYGTQVDQVGAVAGSRTKPRASIWVVDGRQVMCSVSSRDLDDPFVSCGEQLPLPAGER